MGKALGHGIGCDALSRLAGDGIRVSDMSVGVYMWEKRRVSRGIDVKHFMDSGALFWHGWAFRWRLLSVPSAYFSDSICRRRHCRIHTFCTCTSRPMDIGMVEGLDAQIVGMEEGALTLKWVLICRNQSLPNVPMRMSPTPGSWMVPGCGQSIVVHRCQNSRAPFRTFNFIADILIIMTPRPVNRRQRLPILHGPQHARYPAL